MGRRGKHAGRKPAIGIAARRPAARRHAARRHAARKHAARKPAVWRGPAALVTVAVASTAMVAGAGVAVAGSASVRAALLNWSGVTHAHDSTGPAAAVVTARHAGHRLGVPAKSASAALASASLALTARDYRMCPPAAAACVDLTRHLTWLQSDGRVSFGPVRMEPGPPGTANATPTGTFSVMWKGGPNVMSNTYHEPMPWAVFFAPGGIAFHAGSLTVPSHGCVHLTMANAHYYNEHLAIGAEVVVF
jgi:hypothetical protein